MNNIYKVISIPDATRVLINAGKKNSDISVKDKVEIFSPSTTIIDPNTNEELMPYGISKATLTVTKVYSDFSELRNVKELIVGIPDFNKLLSPLISHVEIEYKEIESEHENVHYDTSTTLKKGDFCRIIYEK